MSVRDPGLQPERTALAWQRTAAAMLVLAAAVSVGAFRRGIWSLGLIGGLVAIVTFVLAIRFRLAEVHGASDWPQAWPSLLRVAILAGVLAVLGVATAVVSLIDDV